MKLVIPGTLPSLNEMINYSKTNKFKYVKMKDDAIATVSWLAKKQLGNVKIKKADFIITWYCPNRRKDKDNISAGQKFIFDGLQDAGILSNDGWQEINSFEHRFEIDKVNPRVEVEIREVEGNAATVDSHERNQKIRGEKRKTG